MFWLLNGLQRAVKTSMKPEQAVSTSILLDIFKQNIQEEDKPILFPYVAMWSFFETHRNVGISYKRQFL
jgi:hypothetical protein